MNPSLSGRTSDALNPATALRELSTLFARVHWSDARTRRPPKLRCTAPTPGPKSSLPTRRVTHVRVETVHLPHRELETLCMLAKGFTVGQAAVLMGLSSHTVASYTRDVYRKLGVTCRAEATIEAARLGLVGF